MALTGPAADAPVSPAGPADPVLRVHATLARSRANGPGLRFVVWTQGCSLGCVGCFNPETHPGHADPGHAGPDQLRTGTAAPGPRAGRVPVSRLVADVLAAGVEGVTLTGGEPLEQPGAVAAFCRALRRADARLGIVVLSGFARAEIERDAARRAAVAEADTVVAGRYNARLHLGSGLCGSANKEYWALTSRYTPADFADLPVSELVVGHDGSLTVTGMRAWPQGRTYPAGHAPAGHDADDTRGGTAR